MKWFLLISLKIENILYGPIKIFFFLSTLQKKQTTNYKKQTEGGGFFPLDGGEERNGVEGMGLLQECDMTTAQRTTKWA